MLKTYLTVKDYLRIFAIGLGVFVATPSFSQNSPISSLQKQVAIDRQANSGLGYAMDIDGDVAIVGAQNEDSDLNDPRENSGVAYVYRKDGNGNWIQVQQLADPERYPYANFGKSVSISGDYIIIGAPHIGVYDGRVFIFKKNSNNEFVQVKKLGVPYGDYRLRQFGTTVKVEGDIMVIGAPNEEELTPDFLFGKIPTKGYVYKRDASGNWNYVNRISPSSGQYNDQFGINIDIYGSTIIMGAPNRYNSGGTAYIFEPNASGTWVETKKLLPSDTKTNDHFGVSVSIHGNIAVVGAEDQDSDSPSSTLIENSGAAYIFEKQNGDWVEIQKLVASDRSVESSFGYSVAVENDNILVGDHQNNTAGNTNAGSVYLFQKDESSGVWNETKQINSTIISPSDEFGNKVVLSNGNIIISAPKDDQDLSEANHLTNSGALYFTSLTVEDDVNLPEEVFVGPEDKFVPNDRDSHDDFGTAIAISGDFAIVGADREDHDANDANKLSNSGSAYILGKNQYGYWNEVQKLIPSDREDKDFFGQAVDIDGDYAVISSFNRVNKNDGAAYVFKKGANDVWVETDKLIIPNAATNPNFFGASVAISGDVIAIGAPEETVVENGQTLSKAGKIYVFEKDGFGNWIFATELVSSDIATKDRLGFSVDIDGNNIIAGAYFNNPQSNGSNINDGGAAYIFSKQNGSWVESQKLIANNAFHADYFGYDVSIDGDVAVVGAYGQDQGLFDITKEERAGGAYIFKNENGTWSQVQELIADDREADDRFGSSVAINGSNILIGAYGDNKPGSILTNGSNKAGAAYAYHTSDFNQWSLIRKINSDFREEGDEFGKSVALYGEDIIIGAPGEEEDRIQDNEKDRAGAVYFYNISTTPFAKTAFDNDNNNTTGIEELSNTVKAFPNPIENQLTIQLDNTADKIDIQVINLNGQVVEQLSVENQAQVQLQLEHLTAGIYIVKVNTDIVSNVIQVVKK